jgi:hypothetical protein
MARSPMTAAAKAAREYFRQNIPASHRGHDMIPALERQIVTPARKGQPPTRPLATAKACLRKLQAQPVQTEADGRPASVPQDQATFDDEGLYNGVPAGFDPVDGRPTHGNVTACDWDKEYLRLKCLYGPIDPVFDPMIDQMEKDMWEGKLTRKVLKEFTDIIKKAFCPVDARTAAIHRNEMRWLWRGAYPQDKPFEYLVLPDVEIDVGPPRRRLACTSELDVRSRFDDYANERIVEKAVDEYYSGRLDQTRLEHLLALQHIEDRESMLSVE